MPRRWWQARRTQATGTDDGQRRVAPGFLEGAGLAGRGARGATLPGLRCAVARLRLSGRRRWCGRLYLAFLVRRAVEDGKEEEKAEEVKEEQRMRALNRRFAAGGTLSADEYADCRRWQGLPPESSSSGKRRKQRKKRKKKLSRTSSGGCLGSSRRKWPRSSSMAGFAGFGASHAVSPSFVGRAELPGVMVFPWLSWFFWEMTLGKCWCILSSSPVDTRMRQSAGFAPNFTHFFTSSRTRIRFFFVPLVSDSHLFSVCLAFRIQCLVSDGTCISRGSILDEFPTFRMRSGLWILWLIHVLLSSLRRLRSTGWLLFTQNGWLDSGPCSR